MFHEFRIGREQLEAEDDRRISLAWHIAAFERQKKLPKLETLLAKRQRGPQTVTSHRTMLQSLSEQYGIPIRKTRLKRREAKP